MPAPPKLPYALGAVGLPEILLEAIAEQRGNADRDVAVGAEIAVDLNGVAPDRQGQIDGAVGERIEEHGIDDLGRQVVRHHDLLEQSHDDEQQAHGRHGAAWIGRTLELRHHHLGADDRAGHELGEERNVQEDVEDRSRRRDHAAIDVDDVGDALEGEERDPDREHDLEKRQLALQPYREHEVVQALDEEAVILEEPQSDEVERHAYAKDPTPPPAVVGRVDQQAGGVVDRRIAGEQEAEPPIPVPVEEVAGRHQKELAAFGVLPDRPADDEDDEKEDPEV